MDGIYCRSVSDPAHPGPLLAGGQQATWSAAFAKLFESIGENFPAAKSEQNPYGPLP